MPGVPAVQPAAYVVPSSSLTASGIPAAALTAYQRAAAAAPKGCGISWSLLAAIGRVESNHGRFGGATLGADGRSTPHVLGPVLDGTSTALIPDTDGGRLDGSTTYDRAVGPMQFIPSTWARYGVDADGDGVADPFDINDAAAAAARYLCVAGGNLTTTAGQARAVLAYNHSDSYVATVLTLAAAYSGGRVTLPAAQPLPAIEPVNPAPPSALDGVPPTVPSGAPVTPPPSDPSRAPRSCWPTVRPRSPLRCRTPRRPHHAARHHAARHHAARHHAARHHAARHHGPVTTPPGTTTPGGHHTRDDDAGDHDAGTTTPGTTTPGTTTPGTTTPGTTTPGPPRPGQRPQGARRPGRRPSAPRTRRR